MDLRFPATEVPSDQVVEMTGTTAIAEVMPVAPKRGTRREKKVSLIDSDVNLVVVIGELAALPTVLTVSGETVTMFELRVRREGKSVLVPIRWPGEHDDLSVGGRLGVHGAVSRRFFRVGPTTQSRTEVLAERVEVLTTSAKQARLVEFSRRCLES
jgi:hypothetical protein